MTLRVHCDNCHREMVLTGEYSTVYGAKQHAEYTYSFYCRNCSEDQ